MAKQPDIDKIVDEKVKERLAEEDKKKKKRGKKSDNPYAQEAQKDSSLEHVRKGGSFKSYKRESDLREQASGSKSFFHDLSIGLFGSKELAAMISSKIDKKFSKEEQDSAKKSLKDEGFVEEDKPEKKKKEKKEGKASVGGGRSIVKSIERINASIMSLTKAMQSLLKEVKASLTMTRSSVAKAVKSVNDKVAKLNDSLKALKPETLADATEATQTQAVKKKDVEPAIDAATAVTIEDIKALLKDKSAVRKSDIMDLLSKLGDNQNSSSVNAIEPDEQKKLIHDALLEALQDIIKEHPDLFKGGTGEGGFNPADLLDLMDSKKSRGGRGGKGLLSKAGKFLGRIAKVGKGAVMAGGAALAGGAAETGATLAKGAASGASAIATGATEGVAAGASAATGAAEGATSAAGSAAKGGSKMLKSAKNILGFLKKVPGLSVIAAGASVLMEVQNAITQNEQGTIDDNELHKRVTSAVGGAMGGIGGAELGVILGSAVGSVIPIAGTVVGAIAGGIGGFIGGEKLGKIGAEKLFDYFEKTDNIPTPTLKKTVDESAALAPAKESSAGQNIIDQNRQVASASAPMASASSPAPNVINKNVVNNVIPQSNKEIEVSNDENTLNRLLAQDLDHPSRHFNLG